MTLLHGLTYSTYLQSPWWRMRRYALLQYRGARCERCGRTDRPLQVHHRTYERLGRELPEDLEVLCKLCHTKEHIDKLSYAQLLELLSTELLRDL